MHYNTIHHKNDELYKQQVHKLSSSQVSGYYIKVTANNFLFSELEHKSL
jgi:hypothetical protein